MTVTRNDVTANDSPEMTVTENGHFHSDHFRFTLSVKLVPLPITSGFGCASGCGNFSDQFRLRSFPVPIIFG